METNLSHNIWRKKKTWLLVELIFWLERAQVKKKAILQMQVVLSKTYLVAGLQHFNSQDKTSAKETKRPRHNQPQVFLDEWELSQTQNM